MFFITVIIITSAYEGYVFVVCLSVCLLVTLHKN